MQLALSTEARCITTTDVLAVIVANPEQMQLLENETTVYIGRNF
jgi:hypothetical protein